MVVSITRLPAHPRSRGENILPKMRLGSCSGSSPLTRGKPGANQATACHSGLIPAHAGKTAQDVIRLSRHTAHPRSRGENLPVLHPSMTVDGSSPLTRGKRTGPEACHHQARLIPAHAGKTRLSPPRSRTTRAHPRSRGENAALTCRSFATRGSSPLTRGKLDRVHALRVRDRLIPAHAGKTRP